MSLVKSLSSGLVFIWNLTFMHQQLSSWSLTNWPFIPQLCWVASFITHISMFLAQWPHSKNQEVKASYFAPSIGSLDRGSNSLDNSVCVDQCLLENSMFHPLSGGRDLSWPQWPTCRSSWRYVNRSIYHREGKTEIWFQVWLSELMSLTGLLRGVWTCCQLHYWRRVCLHGN